LAAAGYLVELATTTETASNQDGVQLVPLGSQRGLVGRILRDIRALILMLRQPKKVIIHIHDPELLLSAAIPVLLGRKLVYDVHEFYESRIAETPGLPVPFRWLLSRAYTLAERLIVRRFSGVVIVSEGMCGRYESLVGHDRVALVQNFPAISDAQVQEAVASPHPVDGRKFIVHTGGASKLRAYHVLVEAAEYLRSRGCDWPILNLGKVDLTEYSPDERSKLFERGERSGIRNVGQLSQSEAWRYVSHATIGCMPLLPVSNNAQGQPQKLFEYLRFGLPIVATDLTNIARFIKATSAGILVPPEDGRAMGLALYSIAGDPSALERYSSAAKKAANSYSFSTEFEKLCALYDRIVLGRLAQRPSVNRG